MRRNEANLEQCNNLHRSLQLFHVGLLAKPTEKLQAGVLHESVLRSLKGENVPEAYDHFTFCEASQVHDAQIRSLLRLKFGGTFRELCGATLREVFKILGNRLLFSAFSDELKSVGLRLDMRELEIDNVIANLSAR